jgi:hypothetical protein
LSEKVKWPLPPRLLPRYNLILARKNTGLAEVNSHYVMPDVKRD